MAVVHILHVATCAVTLAGMIRAAVDAFGPDAMMAPLASVAVLACIAVSVDTHTPTVVAAGVHVLLHYDGIASRLVVQ
jgi:hypothetical protein